MTNVVFDFGNSLSKAAIFKEHKITAGYEIPSGDITVDWINSVIQRKEFQKLTYASVIELPQIISARIENMKGYHPFKSKTIHVLKNNYKSIRSLGSDRLAAALGSRELFASKNVLTIICGSCITYNFVNTRNEYMGGSISPGLNMRLHAMHQFTGRLPLITLNKEAELIGRDTGKSLQSGTFWGAVSEIDGMIDRYTSKYKSLTVVLSGGDAPVLQRRLKNKIFAIPDLVLKGLNYYLQLNDKNI